MPLTIAGVSSALNPMAAFTLSCFTPKTLAPSLSPLKPSFAPLISTSRSWALAPWHSVKGRKLQQPLMTRAAMDSDYSAKRSSSSETRETIMLPGCDYNHWLIVMEFPKDPAPTREQMIDTYLNTLATVLGRFVL